MKCPYLVWDEIIATRSEIVIIVGHAISQETVERIVVPVCNMHYEQPLNYLMADPSS